MVADPNFHNDFIDETIFYFFPIIFTTVVSVYFFTKKKKTIVVLMIIAGVLYYLWILFGVLWTAGEGCFPLFYGLIKPSC